MEVQQYIRTVRDGWWIIIAALLFSVSLGMLYSFSQTPMFEATATFVANPSTRIADSGDILSSLDTLARRSGLVSTYCTVLSSDAILEQGVAALGIAKEMVENYIVSCVVLPDSSILALRAQGPSPYMVADLANAVGASGLTYITSLQDIFELRRLDLAVVNTDAISPNHPVDVILAAVIGLMGGVAFLFLRQALERPFGQSGSGAIVNRVAGTASMDYLRQRLEEEISRSRLQNYPLNLAVMVFEPLDDLSQYPEAVMQRLQRQLAVFLQDRSRPLDLLAYIRNNTFGVLMPEINGMEARDIMVDLLADLRLKVFALEDLNLSVAFQGVVGLVENSNGEADWRAMMKMAQEASEAASHEGPYQVYLKRTSPGPFFDVLFAES